MEGVTIKEYRHYQENKRNVIIMIFKGIGLCGMDTLLVTEGEREGEKVARSRGRAPRRARAEFECAPGCWYPSSI